MGRIAASGPGYTQAKVTFRPRVGEGNGRPVDVPAPSGVGQRIEKIYGFLRN